jgi:hypothetical protein
MARRLLTVLPLFLAAHASGQTELFGFRANGDVVRINPATGAATPAVSTGAVCDGAAARNGTFGRQGETHGLVMGGGQGATADQIILLEGWTAGGQTQLATTGRPAGYGIRGMAFPNPEASQVFVILASADPTVSELLGYIDLTTGAYTVVGSMGRSDLWGLTAPIHGGTLYAVGTENGGALYLIDFATGAATLIGGGDFGGDDHALALMPNNTLLACGANLRSVDPVTGATTLIGPTGYNDIHALAVVSGCYPNCTDGAPPLLNVNDFVCFQVRFVAGDPYTNCDFSTTPPILNVNDFICFMARFANGCSQL